jgi:hypothetical protein
MSEKLQEFIEVPQQFVRDGRQVCLNTILSMYELICFQFIMRCNKPTEKGLLHWLSNTLFSSITHRIPSNLQGSGSWFCSHGFHRLFREAYSYSNVCVFS